MRLPFIFLVLMLLALALTGSAVKVLGQPDSTAEAFTKLVQAYSSVQSAESHGVSHDQVIGLFNEMNQALVYYENSTALLEEKNSTGAQAYATLSISVSSDVMSKASTLQNSAQVQLLERQAFAYGLAVSLAIISAFAVVEFHRLRTLLQRRRVFRTAIRSGEP